MNKKIIFGLILISFLLVLANCSQAGSIWAKRSKDVRVMYADDTARQIGDILTIIITEKSKVDNKAKRDLKKDTSRSIIFNGEVGGFVDLGEFGLSAESSNELKGKADFKDERSFIDFMTVVVVDILPNGNLVVMGTRTRNIAGDTQTIEASGIVRPSDISFNNTVKSEKVADFHIVSRNSGVAEPYNRQGWLGRIFDILWPF